MTTKNGLPCDFVIAFIQDKEKHWWLYTRCGVVGFSDAELQKWWANADAVIQNRVYDAFDGAQPNIGSFNAAASTSDGRVWFSSGVVVQMLDPSRMSQSAGPAAATVESLIVDRKEFAAIDNLEVGPHVRDLQIDYTSPTFSIPQKVKFRYKLDGYDDDWHEAGPRRQAFYTDVPPRKSTFRVMAANSDGVWNERAATLAFSIAPAYCQTTWFRAVSAASFVALLWAAYRYRMRRVQHAFALTLDARVGERTRIARELHDTLLQSFHGLLLRFQTASSLLPIARQTRKRNWIRRFSRRRKRSPKAATPCRACGHRPSNATISPWRSGPWGTNSPPTRACHQPSTFSVESRANRGICSRSFATRSTRSRRKPCGTPFGTRRPVESRSRSVTTARDSGCG